MTPPAPLHPRLTRPGRLLAAVTALLAFGALAVKVAVAAQGSGPGAAAVLWELARYFTILTNAAVALAFGWMTVTGLRIGGRLAAGLVLWIGATGLLYRLLLAELWEPRGLEWIGDQGVHTAVPLAVFLWWLVYGGTRRLTWVDPLAWLLWPAAYLAYALLRGAVDGVYPYPFLDPARLSWVQLTWNVSRLIEGFAAAGYVLLALAWLKRTP